MKRILFLLAASGALCGTQTRAQMAGCVPLPEGLVSWWRGEGNARDSIGANDGLIVDGVSFAPAEAGGGFVFSGTGDDYVALPQNLFPVPASGTGTTPFSFELWFKTGDAGVILGQQDVAPFAVAPGNVPGLYVGTNGQLHASMFWSGDVLLTSPTRVDDNQFHHAAVTYDGINQALFLDGVLIASAPFVQQGYATNYWYQLGTGWTDGWPDAPGGWLPFRGIIDEVSLYQRALAPWEVAEIFEASQAGKCALAGPLLLHRYSFSGPPGSKTVPDSVRTADGVLLSATDTFPYTNGPSDGSSLTGSGALNLNGTNGYVQLPPNLISALSNVSFEVWITWRGPSTSSWQRVFDFGYNDQGTNQSGTGTNYMVLSPARGGTRFLGFEETTVDPFQSIVDPKALVLNAPFELPTGKSSYLALTYDPIAGSAKLYLDGNLMASASGSFNPLSRLMDYNDWLGRSQWHRDPFFNGQFDEFRIWDGVLSAQDVAGHYQAGPDEPIFVSRPRLYIAPAIGEMTLSWSTNYGRDLVLQSASTLNSPNWSPVTNSATISEGRYQITVPAAQGRGFYRLSY